MTWLTEDVDVMIILSNSNSNHSFIESYLNVNISSIIHIDILIFYKKNR